MEKSITVDRLELENMLRNTIFEAIHQDRRQFARILLQELGYKPKATKGRMTQAEALRVLQPVKIGRAKLDTYVRKGIITAPEKIGDSKNSQVTYIRDEIYKLRNR